MEYETGDKVTLVRVDAQSMYYVKGMERFVNHDGILQDMSPGDVVRQVQFGDSNTLVHIPSSWYEHTIMISLSDVLAEIEGGPWDNVRHLLEKRFRKTDPAILAAITLLEQAGYTVTKTSK